MPKRKKDSGQPELPIEGAHPVTPVEIKKKKTTATNGNDADHVIAETVETTIVHKPFDPKKLEAGLHTRVDRGFLDYASYVIRDRAIPNLADGFKPVQRRIMWALHEKDDGRFIKVANVVGHTMQYHPHGDASIGDALFSGSPAGAGGITINIQGGNYLDSQGANMIASALATQIQRQIRLKAYA